MFPFAALFRGIEIGLQLTAVNENMNGGWNNNALVGFRCWGADFASRRRSVFTTRTNEWIHSDAKPTVDASLYEFRVFNINQSGIGDAVINGFTDEVWRDCTGPLNWWLSISGAEFDPFKSGTVTGEMAVREKADVGNIRTSTFDLFVSYEGQS